MGTADLDFSVLPVARSRRRERQTRKIKVTGEALQPLKDSISSEEDSHGGVSYAGASACVDTTIIPRGEPQAGLSAASQGSPSGSEEILLDSRVNDLRLSSGSSGATSEDTQLRLLSVKAQMKAHKSLAKRCGKSFPNLSEATNYAYEQNRRHARTHARTRARTHAPCCQKQKKRKTSKKN